MVFMLQSTTIILSAWQLFKTVRLRSKYIQNSYSKQWDYVKVIVSFVVFFSCLGIDYLELEHITISTEWGLALSSKCFFVLWVD